jgi:hypothetical protein
MSEQVYLNSAMSTNYKLMNDLNTFNLQYAKYIKCNGANPPPTLGNCKASDLTCCSTNDIGDVGLGKITTLQGTLLTDIDSARTTGNVLYGNLISNTQFQTNQSKILSSANDINKIRTELDTKMREIYNIDGNLHQDYFLQYDSVMYTGILFSILATTILYYTFTKL